MEPAAAGLGACGDTITTDVTLTANLRACTGDGLIIAADGVRVDLNGHSVTRSGGGTGNVVCSKN